MRGCSPGRPTARRARPRAQAACACRSPTTAAFFATLPSRCARPLAARWGAPERDPFCRRRRLPRSPSTASATSSSASSRRAATTSIRRRPITIRTSCRRTAISPSMPGCARSFGARRDRPCRQARQSRMAAGQGAGAVGDVLAGSGARAAAARLSVHRQRSGRGHAGEAARRRRDRRSSDAADDARRDLRRRSPSSRR